MDQSSFAAPHGFSQRITSFIACACQGIHQMPFFHLIVLIANAHRLCWIWQTYPPRLRSKGCQIRLSGTTFVCRNSQIRRPCSHQTSYARLPFTIALSNNAIDVFDRSALLEPRRAVRLQPVLRPASRDLSGDARSGNINPAQPPEGRSEEHPNNDHASLDKTSFLPPAPLPFPVG